MAIVGIKQPQSPSSVVSKTTGLKKRIYKNRKIAIADISNYIELFNNPVSQHQHLGGVSSDEFEAAVEQT